eukprot:1136206_1
MGACCDTQNLRKRGPPAIIRIKTEESDIEDDNDNEYEIENGFTHYQVGRTLGTGAWADVVQAHNKTKLEHEVAIKIMTKTKKNKKLYERELSIFEILTSHDSHPNIVPFIGNGEDKHSYYILTGLMTGGELFDHIIAEEEEHKISEHKAYPLILRMLDAVQYCHKHNVVHRDLKPENFVFEDNSSTSNIVLIDFGHSRHAKDDEVIVEDVVGTPDYMSAELAATVLDGYKRNGRTVSSRVPSPPKHITGRMLKATDVWAIGIIAYVMVTGRAPFYGDNKQQIYESICVNPVTFPDRDVRYNNVLNLGEHFKDFIRKTLIKNPEKRITIEEAMRHPWVQGVTAVDFKLNKEVLPWLKQRQYQSKLKKETARVLAANMTGDLAEKVISHFERLDKDGDGFLDFEGLTLLFLHMGYTDCEAQKEAQQLIKEVDKIEDGKIDLDDFKQVYYRKVLSSDDRYIHRVFSVFDRDGDGFIDVNDLKSIMAPGGKRKSTESDGLLLETIETIFDEVAPNKDGKIDFKEFKIAMKDDAKGARRFSFDNY